MTIRTAVITNATEENRETISSYMPACYEVLEGLSESGNIMISGEDVGGWTLDDYVLPRLASGLWFGRETFEIGAEVKVDGIEGYVEEDRSDKYETLYSVEFKNGRVAVFNSKEIEHV